MSEFMTAEALMMKHILEKLQEDIKESNERQDFLLDKGMYEDLEQEEAYSDTLYRDYNMANKLFDSLSKWTASAPNRVTISNLTRFGEHKISNHIHEDYTREHLKKLSNYKYIGTDLTLGQWRDIAEGTVYIVYDTSILIEKEDGRLFYRYTREEYWHPLNESGSTAEQMIFEKFGARKLFQLHSE